MLVKDLKALNLMVEKNASKSAELYGKTESSNDSGVSYAGSPD